MKKKNTFDIKILFNHIKRSLINQGWDFLKLKIAYAL